MLSAFFTLPENDYTLLGQRLTLAPASLICYAVYAASRRAAPNLEREPYDPR